MSSSTYWQTDSQAPRATSGARQPASGDAWIVHELLGRGSFSEVWSARPATAPADRPADYAVKLVRREYQSDARVLATFAREAELGRTISHPHLVPVLDSRLQMGDVSYVVMPRLRGALASQALESVGSFAVPHALWIARQVAEATSALHANDWLHGDIKPANIHVTPEGHVTLLDLGLARRVHAASARNESAERDVVAQGGSLAYAAPEMLVARNHTTLRCDVYSLGVTLYQLLTGQLPFRDRTAGQLVRAHLTRPAPDPRLIVPEIPETVAQLTRTMLCKEPLRRPYPLSELTEQLRTLEWDALDRNVLRRDALQRPADQRPADERSADGFDRAGGVSLPEHHFRAAEPSESDAEWVASSRAMAAKSSRSER